MTGHGFDRKLTAALIVTFSLATAGCAPTIWDKPGATQADFNQDSARCRLLARGMNLGDFYAQGSRSFVIGAALGNALGTAVNQQETYEECMMAMGYSAEEEASPGQPGATPGHCGGGPGLPSTC